MRIKVNDQPTEEWQVEETLDRIECFIESKAGQEFSVRVLVSCLSYTLTAECRLVSIVGVLGEVCEKAKS